jgi:membrane-associated protease RseP (regulator of RpoE activity)
MTRYLFALVVVLTLAVLPARAQSRDPAPAEEKGTYLGVLISPVPDILYDQLPDLPRNQGVVITHVLPDSPAARAGLRRHDVLLAYNDDKIRDCEHFSRLVRDDKADSKVKLELLRGGQKQTIEVTLALGPVLKIAQSNRAGVKDAREVPPGTAKTGAPPSVSVAATPMDGGKMKVTIEYYQEGTGRLKTVTCEGTPADIDTEVQKLPMRVQSLANLALARIRKLEIQPADVKAPAATPSRP